MQRKEITIILIVLILLGIIGFVLIMQINPPINQYRNYVVSGKVITSGGSIGGQPQSIQIYYPYYAPEYLCRSSSQVQTSKIEWVDNTTGKFEALFTVPVGLSKVIITTDCSSCENQEIDLGNIPNSVNLIWGKRNCENNIEILDSGKEKIIEHARNFLNGIEVDIVNKPFNSTEMQSIKEDLKMGKEAVAESERINTYNESIIQAYYAEWFAWKAQYKKRLFELKYCLGEVNAILDQYKNDNCYAPEYKSSEDYSSANRTYYSSENTRLLNDYPYSIKEPERMKEEIRHINIDGISDANNRCTDSLIINKTFEKQKPYCEARKFTIGINLIILAIVSLYIGILIGNFLKVEKHEKNK